ncbi:Arm DNA-binding domain-containing protein [Bradyrhizobium sp. DASA03068]|uniref:Arm DNA-binding domain-containing protein n=1 Tax=Bradyrhizobium sp. BLXBL-01 TaxID=3395915 RepID=UPI003F71B01D
MLNDTKVRNAKPTERDYKLTDFDGLYLLVCKNGSRLWRFAVARLDGRARLGECHDQPAAEQPH